MIVGQLDQRLAIYRVAGEQLGVLAEALGLEPRGQIGHNRPPMAPPAKLRTKVWAALSRLSTAFPVSICTSMTCSCGPQRMATRLLLAL
jgi:hypothetical protein